MRWVGTRDPAGMSHLLHALALHCSGSIQQHECVQFQQQCCSA